MMKCFIDVTRANPTKQFFVPMLTRDICLADTILGLVDNGLDGGNDVDYAQFVKIALAADWPSRSSIAPTRIFRAWNGSGMNRSNA